MPVTGGCGVPAQAQAVSFNVTVTNTLGAGFILAYPTGGAAPTVSTVNDVAAQTIANAAVVPLGTDGKATFVAGASGTDLILDVNGCYAPQAVVNTLASSSDLNLTGRLVVDGDSGAAGEGLTSAGAGSPPTRKSGAPSGLDRFACTYDDNAHDSGLTSFTTSGNDSTESGPLDPLGTTYDTGSDFTIDLADNTITVDRTGLYRFEGMVR